MKIHHYSLAALVAVLLTACNLGSVRDTTVTPETNANPLFGATQPPSGGAANTPSPINGAGDTSSGQGVTPVQGVWVQPGVPPIVEVAVAPIFEHPAFYKAETPGEAVLQVGFSPGASSPLTTQWIYAVVAPFPTIPDHITWEALGAYWQGQANTLPEFGNPRLVLSQDVADLLTTLYGPMAETTPLTIVPVGEVLDTAWNQRPSLSVVPFETLDPRWKVLSVNQQSPLDKGLNTETYPFVVDIGISGDAVAAAQAAAIVGSANLWPPTNRDPARMTTVTLTGVTALSRAVGWQMELTGVTEQGDQIKDTLASADILHVSNEVAFASDCPPPDPNSDPVFCSADKYMDLFNALGVDVIELTGNHINDWGTGALNHTLDIYEQNGIPSYGGGRTLVEAGHILYVDSFGNRVAFVGCNLPGPFKAWASQSTPGALPCDDYAAFYALIAEAKQQSDVVIVTQQYWEFQHPEPTPQQVADFAALVEAGADIVSGSQAHQPQSFAFHNGRFVHYGLGNLFFDPLQAVEKDFFVDKVVIYDGRHISTTIVTGILEDYGRPRLMTDEERRVFLATMFGVSGW